MLKKYKKGLNPDIIRYPIITDKTTKDIENNKYYFKVERHSKKNDIKEIIEYIFDVKVKKINTLNYAKKNKTIGKFKGRTSEYKKAIIKLHKEYTIKLFED